MSRSTLKWKDGFATYGPENLDKVNAWRAAASMKDKDTVPILDRPSVLFSTAESANDEPRSCANCFLYNSKLGKCEVHSPTIQIKKFTKGAEFDNPIEYWPVCGYWMYGTAQTGDTMKYRAQLDPDDSGLCWVNAPKPGLERSGTCCGGANEGDDCDLWNIEGTKSKMDSATGFCRVLQSTTANMDCCSSWTDDDLISWRVAQDWIKKDAR